VELRLLQAKKKVALGLCSQLTRSSSSNHAAFHTKICTLVQKDSVKAEKKTASYAYPNRCMHIMHLPRRMSSPVQSYVE
jgi:hypothetical protein